MLAMIVFHLFLWLRLWLAAPALPDFHNTYVAGTIWLSQHANAYNVGLAEAAQANSASAIHSPYHFNPFVQIPAWLWVAGLLARLPYGDAYLVLTLANIAMVAVSAWIFIGTADIPRRHRTSLYLVVAAALPTWLDLFQAQTMPLALLATAGGYKLSATRPKVAGLALSLAGFRYHVFTPVVLALACGRRRLQIGLLLGLLALAVASLAAVDGNLMSWITTTHYVSTVYQPADYSLRYFVRFSPQQFRSALDMAIMPVGVAVGTWLFWRLPRDGCAGLLAVAIAWSLVTPYSYPGDFGLIVLLTAGYLAELTRQGTVSVSTLAATCTLLAAFELPPNVTFLVLFPAEVLMLISLTNGFERPTLTYQSSDRAAACSPVTVSAESLPSSP